MSSKQKTAPVPGTALAPRLTQYTEQELLALGEIDQDAMFASGKVEDAFMSIERFKEVAKRSGLIRRQITRLKAGESVVGVYVGPGPTITMNPDRKTGEVKTIKTHGVQVAEQVIADLMGSYQLDREFVTTQVGALVMIAHNGQIETKGGQRVNDYQFLRAGKSITDILEDARAKQDVSLKNAGAIEASSAD